MAELGRDWQPRLAPQAAAAACWRSLRVWTSLPAPHGSALKVQVRRPSCWAVGAAAAVGAAG
eukprot:scaffold585432_cov13-Prasinocladus_malaysianus.AAC.1